MITFLISMFLVMPSTPIQVVTCPTPSNVYVVTKNGGSIQFDWDDCGCVLSDYKVKFTRVSDSYTSPDYSTSSSGYTFNNLQSGTYLFYFWTACEAGASEAIVIEDYIAN